jgi:HlyD family secretion protein
VTAALAALPLIEVDVTVRAPGVVRPATERTELRVPLSAQIAQVLARDNDTVTAGQPLLVLRSRDLDERLALNRTRQTLSTSLITDLTRLTPAATDSSPANPFPLKVTTLETPELRADLAQLHAQWATQQLTQTKASRELARSATLAAKGLISTRDHDQAHDDLAAARADTTTLLRAARTRWETRLRDEQTTLTTLRTEENRIAEEVAQTTLRAPATGSIQGLTGLFPGAWLSAGQMIGAVSPSDALLIETYVSPKDVGLLRLGQPARLQIDAYPYTQWGLLDAIVTTLAADSSGTNGANSTSGFKVTLQPAATTLYLPNGAAGPLRKGLTLSARFVVARRSLFQILYEDVSAWLNPQEPQSREL